MLFTRYCEIILQQPISENYYYSVQSKCSSCYFSRYEYLSLDIAHFTLWNITSYTYNIKCY